MTTSAPERAHPSLGRLGYRPDLDGIRAVAVVLVLGAHMRTLLPDVSSVWLQSGFFGVDVFFVLSGFLITTLLLEESDTNGDVSFSAFIGRRAFRLLPALAFGVVVAAVCASILGRNGPGMPFLRAALWVITSVANWSDASLGLLAHTWSLGVEQQYYLLWPLVLLLCLARRVQMRWIFTGLVVTSVAIAGARFAVLHGGGPTDQVWGILRADAIVIGSALAALLALDGGKVRRFFIDRRVIFGGATLVVLYVLYAEVSGRVGRATMSKDLLIVGAVGFAMVLGSIVVRRGGPAPILSDPRVVALGRLSYPVYLVHYPVFGVLSRLGPSQALVRVAVGLGLTFALAVVAHHYVEQPALGLKRRLDARRAVVT